MCFMKFHCHTADKLEVHVVACPPRSPPEVLSDSLLFFICDITKQKGQVIHIRD